MKKERLKNLILTTLIISAVFLTSQIWFNKKLWPDGYNFFAYVENLPFIGRFFNNDKSEDVTIEQSIAQLAVPYKAVVSGSDKREVFTPDEQEFDVISRMSFGVIDDLLKDTQPDYSTASLSDVKAALSESSVFLTYEYDMDTAFIADARGIDGNGVSKVVPSFAHIILTDDLSGNGVIYLCNSDNSSIYRFVVQGDGEKVKKIVSAYSRQNENYAFAYELNLDAPQDATEFDDRLYLSTFVLVNVGVEKEESTVIASNPLGDSPSTKTCDGLVESFGLKANNLRRSKANDGSYKYIENSATITVSPKGTVLYDAVANQTGITAGTTAEKIEKVLEIVIDQWQMLHPDVPIKLCVAENMTTSNNTTVISFNYVINGKPVIFFNNGACENGITATFNGDKLTHAKFNLCKIDTTDIMESPMPMLQNFDSAYEQLGINNVVTHAISCYAVEYGNTQPMSSTLAITYDGKTGIVK